MADTGVGGQGGGEGGDQPPMAEKDKLFLKFSLLLGLVYDSMIL